MPLFKSGKSRKEREEEKFMSHLSNSDREDYKRVLKEEEEEETAIKEKKAKSKQDKQDKKAEKKQQKITAKQRLEEAKMNKAQTNIDRVKQKRVKKERFEKIHMWAYYAAAVLTKDIGTIPDNIGNRILISSNMYTTKLFLSSIIQVEAMSMRTPITTIEVLCNHLREKGCTAVCDVTFKRQRYQDSLDDSGLRSRIYTWEASMRREDLADKYKENAARCLYTVEQLRAGVPLYYTRMFITLRAQTGTELQQAERVTYAFLDSIKAAYRPVTATVKQTLDYMSVIADKSSKEVKDIPALLTSNLTLAQMMPNCGSFNGSKGLYFGVDILNGSQYNLDLEKVTVGRNLYIVAPSGVGKTVICANIVQSALEHENWRVFINDIKGNEWVNICKSVGGLMLSLTPLSRQYINSFRMNPDHATYENSDSYFSENFNLSKETMITLTGADKLEEVTEMDQLVERFLNSVYNGLGVLASNKNTWDATKDLNPYVIYDMFVDYMTPTMIKRYPLAGEKMLNTLKTTMSREGSKSYIFKEEFDMYDVYKAKCIVANFGLLKYTRVSKADEPIFNLKFSYAQRIKAAYVQYNYNNHFETMVVDEESQIVPPSTMHTYVEDFTLRRAQRQTTILLGNSIQALLDSDLSKPLIENVRGLLIGDLPRDARDTIIKQFDLEEYRDLLMRVGSDEYFKNSFVFINKMEAEPAVPILKFIMGDNKKYKAFTPSAEIDGNS